MKTTPVNIEKYLLTVDVPYFSTLGIWSFMQSVDTTTKEWLNFESYISSDEKLWQRWSVNLK